MSQTNEIMYHLRVYGSITPLEALDLYGCMRLAARVNDLRKRGHEIRTDLVARDGKKWAKYSLGKQTRGWDV